VFSYRIPEGDFRIARRGGGWYIEFNGETVGSFASPDSAALALAECELAWPELPRPPSELTGWTRGEQRRERACAHRGSPRHP